MDKHVSHALIEDATPHRLLAENEEWQLESEKNAGLEMIPRARKVRGLATTQPRLLVCAFPPDPGHGNKLLEAENDATRAVLSNDADLPERELGRVITPTQRTWFELQSSEFSQDLAARLVLSFV